MVTPRCFLFEPLIVSQGGGLNEQKKRIEAITVVRG